MRIPGNRTPIADRGGSRAYRQANIGSWLREQIKTLLERESPEWRFDPRKAPEDYSELLFVQLVDGVLLSAALVEEKTNRWHEANDLLDASLWLSSSLANRPDLLSQLGSLNVEELQIGAVRKLSEPPRRARGTRPRSPALLRDEIRRADADSDSTAPLDTAHPRTYAAALVIPLTELRAHRWSWQE